jgi:hypothetical protein
LATLKLTFEIQVPYVFGPNPSNDQVLDYARNVGAYLYEDGNFGSLLKANLTEVVTEIGEVLYEAG